MACKEQPLRRRGYDAARPLLVATALLSASLLHLPAAAAKPGVVFLTFGGRGGASARGILARSIRARYRIIAGSRLLAACDQLGVKFGKGRPLARAAQHVGAIAVVGGKVVGRRLTFAVFSGSSGRPLVSRAVRWGRRPPAASIRSARATLLRLLAKEARKARRRKPRGGSSGNDMTFSPEPVSQSDGRPAPKPKPAPKAPRLAFDPEPAGKTGGGATPAGTNDGEEEPPDLAFDPSGKKPSGDGGLDLNFKPDGAVKKKPEGEAQPDGKADDGRPPRIEGAVGIGIWSRVFTLNQPAEGQTHSEYKSGAAIALAFALRGHPAAFFTDGFARDIFLRLRFKMAIGLSSRTDPTATEGLSTSMSEVIFDGGYHWNILGKPESPTVELGLGYGATSFSIDWGTQQSQIAAISYSYLLFGLGAGYPFMRALGDAKPGDLFENLAAELRFDYRVVFGAGQLAEDNWYGASSQGGIELSLGLTWRYKGFIARAAYSYTRYFLSFDGGTYNARRDAGQLAAGGALDQYHGANVTVGYSF